MKAVVLAESRALELRTLDIPRPGPGEVLIRSEYCGICGTDLHAAEIDMFRPPVVMGHEFAGQIEDVGPGVVGWKSGDRVTINPNQNACGSCDDCRAGRYNLCHSAIFENSLGVRRDGGMAEYAAISAVHLHKLPEGLDTLRGAWAEPLAVAVRAVRNSGIRLGDHAAVIGGGPVGLLVLQLLRRAGSNRVVVVEPSTFRLAAAAGLGADELLLPGDLSEAITTGSFRPVDRVFECSGHPSALQTAIDMVRPGGSVRLIGASPAPVAFSAMSALAKEVTISANFIYVDEFRQAIELLAGDAVDVRALTSVVVPLGSFDQAFAALRQPDKTIKALIRTGDKPG